MISGRTKIKIKMSSFSRGSKNHVELGGSLIKHLKILGDFTLEWTESVCPNVFMLSYAGVELARSRARG